MKWHCTNINSGVIPPSLAQTNTVVKLPTLFTQIVYTLPCFPAADNMDIVALFILANLVSKTQEVSMQTGHDMRKINKDQLQSCTQN